MIPYNFIKKEMHPANSISDLKVDASFRKLAKNAISFNIWRIDEDRLEAEPKQQYGTFFDDSVYIIYAASTYGSFVNQNTITRESKNNTNFERFIHFWLGENASDQKRSNVSYKVQELDSYFNNMTTQYRESQGNESVRFLSYFKNGICIRSRAVNPDGSSSSCLYQLHGRMTLRCIEMPNISWEHFCSDYIMLLKTEAHVFLWIGRASSIGERRAAITLAQKYQHNTAELSIIDDGYEQSLPEKLKTLWNSFLPLKTRNVSQAAVMGKPTELDSKMGGLRLYKSVYRNARLHLDQIDVVIPTREDLNDSNAVFVLDGSSDGVWLWVGKKCKKQEMLNAMANGRAFVRKKHYEPATPVIRVVEGHEPLEFKRLFPSWPSDLHESPYKIKPVSTNLGKFDSVTLCQRPRMAADMQLIDDGSGERKIYRITKDGIKEIRTSKANVFLTNNCYVVQYVVVLATINPSDADTVGIQSCVYQWNGSEASADTIARAQKFAKSSFDKLQCKCMLAQMSEFDETPHFLQIFDGCLIIMQADRLTNLENADGLNNNHNGNVKSSMLPEHFVLRITGDASYNSKAVEVYPLIALNTKECYVVKTNQVWVWCGHGSTGDAREMAKNVGALLGENHLVLEGKECKDFWRSLSLYANQPSLLLNTNGNGNGNNSTGTNSSNGSLSPIHNTITTNKLLRPPPQLFLLWSQRGNLFSQEILGYEQSDLLPECIYLLDVGLIAYVWLGANALIAEKDKYFKLAQNYLDTVPIARRATTAVAVVRQGEEPNTFKGFFENWNSKLWNNYVSYEQSRQQFITPNNAQHANGHNNSSNGDNGSSPLPAALLNHQKDFDLHQKYPIAMLQQEVDCLPVGVNPLKREVHLTHDDFVSLFNMSFWEYDELPAWKKQELKKKYKLF